MKIIIILNLLILFQASINAQLISVPKIEYKNVKLSKEIETKISKDLAKLMSEYHNSFTQKNYKRFRATVLPQFDLAVGGESGFNILAEGPKVKFHMGRVLIRNQNLANVLSVDTSGRGIWLEVHRIGNAKWKIYQAMYDYNPK